MKNRIVLLAAVCMLLLGGCVSAKTWEVPEAETAGGYTFYTDAMECTVIADGTHKYSRFLSKKDGRTVELFASGTELVLVQSMDGKNYYYRESYEGGNMVVENPLKGVFERLKALEFAFCKQSDGYDVYEAIRTDRIVDAQQIPYKMSLLTMTWSDGKDYVFRYYEYADESFLISAEAPKAINPLLTKDTPWRVDLNKQCVCNIQTGQEVPFTLVSQETGKGLSPNGGETTVTEQQTSIYAYVSSDKQRLERLQYQNGAEITILYTADIVKPEITPDMIPMDGEKLQFAIMLISSIEALI